MSLMATTGYENNELDDNQLLQRQVSWLSVDPPWHQLLVVVCQLLQPTVVPFLKRGSETAFI